MAMDTFAMTPRTTGRQVDQLMIQFLKKDRYRVFIKHCVFSLKFCDFSELCSSAAALVLYLPGVCKHIDTPRENRERPESKYSKIFGKTKYFMYTLYVAYSSEDWVNKDPLSPAKSLILPLHTKVLGNFCIVLSPC